MPLFQIEATVVAVQSMRRLAKEQIGAASRAWAGNMRSTIRTEKRAWEVTTKLLAEATAAGIETLVEKNKFVSCSGDALGGTITCMVTVGESELEYVRAEATRYRRRLVLTVREV